MIMQKKQQKQEFSTICWWAKNFISRKFNVEIRKTDAENTRESTLILEENKVVLNIDNIAHRKWEKSNERK